MSLRNRLLVSYVTLLIVSMGVISAIVLVFLATRPEPETTTYQRLANVIRTYNLESVAQEYFDQNPESTGVSTFELYRAFAEWRGVRILVINPQTRMLIFDSADQIQTGETIESLRISDYVLPPEWQRQLPQNIRVIFGAFDSSEGEEWLYAGLAESDQRFNTRAIIAANARATGRSLQSALADFGSALATPIIQGAILGLMTAFGLAALMSRSIARPLQSFASAAQSIAEGDYERKVSVEGAPEFQAVATAFNRMSSEVYKTHQSQRDFMANVSHDLKTPLTSIQGYSQAIMDGATKDPKQAAAVIHDESSRLVRMVNALTDLARLQSGGIIMHHDRINLSQLVRGTVHRLAVMADEKRVEINISLPDVIEIVGDGDRLVQVFTNLISNAIKYTHTDGHIWISGEQNQTLVTIHIKDDGLGIPHDELPRVFERFYQVDKTRGPKRGTGLGLAITHEIIEAHGGSIEVESQGVNQGSTFTVHLPKAIGKLPSETIPVSVK